MKKGKAVLLTILCTCLFAVPVLALDSTSSATPAEEKGVKLLREKIATQVEEMRKKDQKAYVGSVTKIDGSSMIVSSIQGTDERKYTVKIDDTLTTIYKVVGATKKEIKKSDLVVGSYVIVTGQMISDTLEANEVYIDEQFLVKTAKIIEISKSDYYLKVITYDKDEYILDIQSSTRQFLLNSKTKEIERTGFSNIKEGDAIHFVVSKTNPGSGKEKNRYDAVRILVIPQEFTAQ
jgi:hypothetical protein